MKDKNIRNQVIYKLPSRDMLYKYLLQFFITSKYNFYTILKN